MARHRYGHRRGRPLLVLLGLGLGISALGYWMIGGFERLRPVPLTGELEPEQAMPGLRPIVPPGRAGAGEERGRVESLVASGLAGRTAPERPAPPSTQPGATSRPAFSINPEQAGADLQAGLAARQRDELVEARDLLNRALHSGLSGEQAAQARQGLAEMATQMIFSRTMIAADPLVEGYVVMAGNSLGRLSRRFKVSEDFLAELNGISEKHFIREGARLKIVHGPFHASISKSEHAMHVYLQDVYVRTLKVALGADGRTPVGRWRVANHQANPGWTDPRTGKRWHPDDPANPIGEYWIGLDGIEGSAVGQFGYGIHGTIEPETIGKDVSLGCVRLGLEDIAFVYRLLVPGESYVTITE